MGRRICHALFVSGGLVAPAVLSIAAAPAYAERLHFTYLWHQEQPIYWPDRQIGGNDRYERAWESLTRAGSHPQNNLADIFGLPDRVAAYQYRMRDSIGAFSSGRPEAGAQISFSGGLIENLQSLGGANQLGYTPTWYAGTREARGWTTYSGAAVPRADVVLFGFHHPLLPLCDDSAVRKEIQIQKAIYPDAWGASVPISKGFFPSEMAFSTRLIPLLAQEGFDPEAFVVTVLARAHLEVEVAPGRPDAPDAIRVRAVDGLPVSLLEMRADGYSTFDSVRLVAGRSGVLTVTSDAVTLELLRGDEVVESLSIEVHPGATVRIRR